MGSSREEYCNFIEHDVVKILEDEEHVLNGFTVVLLSNSFSRFGVWAKIKPIIDDLGGDTVNISSLCFYEQIAISPHSEMQYYAENLAFISLLDALTQLSYCITTVVERPRENLSSLPFLKFCGFRRIGSVTEDYARIKNVNSGVFLLDKQDLITTMLGRYRSGILKMIDPMTFGNFIETGSTVRR